MEIIDKDGTIINFEKEDNKTEFRRKFKKAKNDAINFVKNNKELIVASIPVVITCINVANKIVKTIDSRMERTRKDNQYYDRTLGMYVDLKRKPKQSEYIKIQERRNNGEKLSDILIDMGLVKR